MSQCFQTGYPTDARLYECSRERLVKTAEQRGIDLRQKYNRIAKQHLRVGGYDVADNSNNICSQWKGRLYDLQFYNEVPDANMIQKLHVNPGRDVNSLTSLRLVVMH